VQNSQRGALLHLWKTGGKAIVTFTSPHIYPCSQIRTTERTGFILWRSWAI